MKLCSSDIPHREHTWGGRPMILCPGVPEWRKCRQCKRENSVETWEKHGDKCPNCDDLFEREAMSTEPVSASKQQDSCLHLHFTRIANMDLGTFISSPEKGVFRCEECRDIFIVDNIRPYQIKVVKGTA